MRRTVTTYAVVVQVVAILLLQCYPLAPHLGRILPQPHCRGDHRQCGCSPERIASHTCCCNQRKPECCDKEKGHEEEQVARPDGKPSAPYLCTAPCGGTQKFVAASLDKLKYVRCAPLPAIPAGCQPSASPLLRETASSRIMEPPDPPPPKLTILS